MASVSETRVPKMIRRVLRTGGRSGFTQAVSEQRPVRHAPDAGDARRCMRQRTAPGAGAACRKSWRDPVMQPGLGAVVLPDACRGSHAGNVTALPWGENDAHQVLPL